MCAETVHQTYDPETVSRGFVNKRPGLSGLTRFGTRYLFWNTSCAGSAHRIDATSDIFFQAPQGAALSLVWRTGISPHDEGTGELCHLSRLDLLG